MQVKRKERDRQREWYKVEEQGSHKASTEFKTSGHRDRNREREGDKVSFRIIQVLSWWECEDYVGFNIKAYLTRSMYHLKMKLSTTKGDIAPQFVQQINHLLQWLF